MSDSDGLLANNVFTFQNESTIVSAKGPNTNMNNITGISFRNNVFSSTMQMPRPYERHRYAESSYDQRSLSNRREISPMSVRSACDMRQRNCNYSFNPQGMAAPRSAFNGRSGSPMSIRSMGTSASTSVSAIDIVQAIKNEQFNKYELKVIKEACNKYVRHKIRKKFNNRRYRKMHRRRSGYDSGEQGSDSSISSDDRSVGTSNYKDNMSGCRSTITDISNFKRKIKESNMFKDRTDYFKYNSIQNGSGGPINWNTTQSSISSYRMPNMSSVKNMPVPAYFNNMQQKPSAPVMLQKERFKSGFLTMSQRFNRSVIPTSIPENEREVHSEINSRNGHLAMNKNPRRNIETESDEDNIFSNVTKQNQTNLVNRKRSIDSEDIYLPNQKRTKTLSPCKNSIAVQKLKACNDKANNFVFAKPICPARKTVKEKLISKCAVPLSDTISQTSITPLEIQPPQEKSVEEETEKLEEQSSLTCNSTNVSMRPSFIKRKLFTQKLDVSEKINLSMDNLNSPQNSMHGVIQKEKHKARKLQQATTQSCLNRDFQQDESNLLDLIQKIVPIDQMNVTNKTGSQSKNLTEEDDKWDAISTISARKNDDHVSDTYTDEEMLNSTVKELQKDAPKEDTTKGKDKNKKNTPKRLSPPKPKNNELLREKVTTILVGNKQSRIKPFWETDFESDAEFQPSPRIEKLTSKENLRPGKTVDRDNVLPKEAPKTQNLCNVYSSKKPITALNSSQNYTFDTTQKFNSTLRIRSHRAPKRNKLDRTTDENVKTVVLNTEVKPKKIQASTSTKIANAEKEAITIIESKKSMENATKKDSKKSPKGKKQTLKTDKQNQNVQKPNNKKQDNTKAENETNKNEIIAIKAQKKLNRNNKNQDVEHKAQTNKLTTTKKKLAEPKVSNNNNLKTKKTTQKNNSPAIEDHNKTNRPVRSCRTSSRNQTADQSSLSLNETMNRTLRSRKLDLSTTAKKNYTQPEQKEPEKILAVRLSDVSFLLHAEKKTVAKRAVTKATNSRGLNADESDVSFSLTPFPRQTRAASRNTTINSTPLRKNLPHMRELSISNVKPNRRRLPNKRCVY